MRLACLLLLPLLTVFAFAPDTAKCNETVLELRTYVCNEGKLAPLLERFRDHTMKIFEKHGMHNVAYWIPTDGDAADNTLIYLLRHDSADAAKASWEGFRNDPEWKKVAQASAEAHGQILAERPKSVYLTPTDYSSSTTGTVPGKIYELRVYRANDGKLDALHARFRDHTDGIFGRLGMKSFGYWTAASNDDNLLYYVLEFDSRDQAKAAWKTFIADPEWKAAYAASIKDGKLVGNVESTYLRPTDDSPRRKD